MKHLLITLFAATSLLSAEVFDAEQKKAIEEIVHDYLVNQPEVLIEASQALREQQQQETIAAIEQGVLKQPDKVFYSDSPVLGNPDGKVNLVEFVDYLCPHCRRMETVIENLQASNDDLRIVIKLLPIFGEKSILVVKAALAAEKQGKFEALHHALMQSTPPTTKEALLAVAKKAGLDPDQLGKDMEDPAIQETINRNLSLAKALQVRATPVFVIAKNPFDASTKPLILPGGAPQATLQDLIDNIRN